MKGKEKGIYWAMVEAEKGWETERCIYPKGFLLALGDRKVYEKLLKEKVVSAGKVPVDISIMTNPKKIFKPIKTK